MTRHVRPSRTETAESQTMARAVKAENGYDARGGTIAGVAATGGMAGTAEEFNPESVSAPRAVVEGANWKTLKELEGKTGRTRRAMTSSHKA